MATEAVEYIDVTPLPHVLVGMSRQNLPWWMAIAELVDNSFDANATRVSIKCIGRTVVVTDDGRGIPDITTAITLGGHRKHSEHGLGMYGVGLKDAWLSSGDRIEIITTNGGVKRHVDLSPEKIVAVPGEGWKFPIAASMNTDERSGTKIILHLRTGKNKPGTDCWDKLSWAFQPALSRGLQIVQGTERTVKPIPPCRFPSLSESVSESLMVCGKEVRIAIGIMSTGEQIASGPFWVQYKHRNITKTSLGVKEFSDTHVAGIIQLGSGWSLTKNKDDFDEHKEELADAIHQQIRPLLEKAEQLNQDIECAALTAEICGMLNSAMTSPRREKRTKTGENEGTILPKHTDIKRTRAKSVHADKPGSVIGCSTGKQRTGFTLSWYVDDHDETHGQYDYFANRVRLNAGHEFVAKLRSEKNTLALTAVAAAILSDHHCQHEGATRLLCQKKDFSPVFGELTKTMRVGV